MSAGGLFFSCSLSLSSILFPLFSSSLSHDEMLISLRNMTPPHLPLNLSIHLALSDILIDKISGGMRLLYF